jgi:hypothetical protein
MAVDAQTEACMLLSENHKVSAPSTPELEARDRVHR